MRFTLPLLLLTTAPAFADAFQTTASPVAATLYPNFAQVTHHITQTLPAGTHSLVVPFAFDGASAAPQVRSLSGGVTITQIKRQEGQLRDSAAFQTAEQKAAVKAVEDTQKALEAHDRQTNMLGGRVRALEAQLEFLGSLSAGAVEGDPDDLLNVATMVLGESEKAHAEIAKQSALIADALVAREDLATSLETAQAKLARLLPPEKGDDLWAVQVDVASPTDAVLELTGYDAGVFWQPAYDVHLNADTPDQIQVTRKATIASSADTSWSGIDLTISTNQPTGQIGPRPVYGHKATVFEDAPIVMKRTASPSFSDALVEEEVIVVEEAAGGFAPVDHGFAVTYTYGTPVDLGPDDTLVLDLGTLALSSTSQIHASPRYDNTAYLVANITNNSGEPILPGKARLYRDGVLVGEEFMPGLVASDTIELPMGPVEHIRLTYVEKDNQVGERGFIKSATSRTHKALIRVENLSDTAEDLRVFYPTTYSEQEELTVTVNTSPAPTTTDFEDRKGVATWDMKLGGGDTSEISVETTLRWPEGKTLSWQP
ncbi:DUF4139 domain-containing protein [Aliiroseovarius sediminis]|uniref:DUF4139 domain-containing protein n=1 Tax=Aliiroseovarius sediminis TaxID=2925839 RepID=UPI001F5A2F6D|nr:DUF4139 domain-containing protein [Aliiroseovarius sediminis]MCI2395469.1 DUF4139 domain-containing protein [Aliiroseovarius sediminis]